MPFHLKPKPKCAKYRALSFYCCIELMDTCVGLIALTYNRAAWPGILISGLNVVGD